ncbi:MAG: tRNA (guanosine(37)-N1)-methyltransferase TrmD [Candidatus Blackburnbacteria bacterium]|nr:tRNA (guanosine(37)-N1)-methyltransferase TrmD [Candidatus Blackburnbacteria bacterium]
MMRVDILTLFPKMFSGPFDESIIKRAQEKGLVEIKIHNLRDWAEDRHKTVDDRPYGGGVGMILMVEPVDRALTDLRKKNSKVILLDAAGEKFTQSKAQELAKDKHLIFVAGHYEGVDQRIKEYLIDEEISIGDYVLTGGELPAMVVVDAVVRLVHGVLEKPEATQFESFSPLEIGKRESPFGEWKLENSLEYPQYTRPENFRGWKVPKILLGGNHKEIGKWRVERAMEKTKKLRPDLLK